MREQRQQTCCICGKTFFGEGNNPDPVKHEGICCDECNRIVVAERILNLYR